MRWIKVKDKLPKENQPVLVFCKEDGTSLVITAIYTTSSLSGNEPLEFRLPPFGTWWDSLEGGVIPHKITHWKPLPEPPGDE